MAQGQRSVWFQLFANLVVVIWGTRAFLGRYAAGVFDGPDGMVALGRFALVLIGVTIGLSIAVHIVGTIALAIASGGVEPDDMTDERDRAIEFRGERVAHWGSGVGFLLAMVLLVTGSSAAIALATIYAGFLAGDSIGGIVKLVAYQRG